MYFNLSENPLHYVPTDSYSMQPASPAPPITHIPYLHQHEKYQSWYVQLAAHIQEVAALLRRVCEVEIRGYRLLPEQRLNQRCAYFTLLWVLGATGVTSSIAVWLPWVGIAILKYPKNINRKSRLTHRDLRKRLRRLRNPYVYHSSAERQRQTACRYNS